MMFVLDTNVVSELRKVRFGKADTNVTAWTESVDNAERLIAMQKGRLLLRQKCAFYKAVVLSKPQIEAGG